MKKKKKHDPDDREQSARFQEISTQVGSDMDKEDFDKACSVLLKAKKPKKQKGK